jgi:hypothetical protein
VIDLDAARVRDVLAPTTDRNDHVGILEPFLTQDGKNLYSLKADSTSGEETDFIIQRFD